MRDIFGKDNKHLRGSFCLRLSKSSRNAICMPITLLYMYVSVCNSELTHLGSPQMNANIPKKNTINMKFCKYVSVNQDSKAQIVVVVFTIINQPVLIYIMTRLLH